MAGHSKWANIKRRKEAQDAKRGQGWTKVVKEITVAARLGGGDPDANPRLRDAISKAKSQNMPKDNIERAIKKGTGELEGVNYEEVTYEGYGPATDNKNRTVSEIRHVFSKHGGNLGENGCVAWMFEKKGNLEISKEGTTEEELFEKAIDAGAEDIQDDSDVFTVVTAPDQMSDVRLKLEEAGFKILSSEITANAETTVQLEGDAAEKMIKLYGFLEDHDDVQKVFSNFDISEEEMEKFAV
jgi:YebC/PmpR family DNA-binding regulatory protein